MSVALWPGSRWWLYCRVVSFGVGSGEAAVGIKTLDGRSLEMCVTLWRRG